MDRRRFISTCTRALGASLLLPVSRALGDEGTPVEGMPEPVSPPTSFPDLVLAKGDAKEATLGALKALGGMERFVQPGQVVLVKPNASFGCPPDWGATTHPGVLAAVIDACLLVGARRVIVADHTMLDAERCFARNGIGETVAAYPKAKLVSLDKEKHYRPVEVPAGKALHNTEIPSLVEKADVFINLPTAKSHSATGVSLGLKNLMGLVWDRHRFHSDMDLHQGIADLATVLRPHLTIIDAMRILETGGPTGPGKVHSFDGVFAGTDPVAVDAFGVGLSTWEGQTLRPDQVPYLKQAAEHGLGTLALDTLHIEELS